MLDILNDATVQIQGTCYYPLDLGRKLTTLLEREPRLEMLAILAAGLPGVIKEDRLCRKGKWEAKSDRVCELLQDTVYVLFTCRAHPDVQQRGGPLTSTSRAAPP